MLVRCRMIPNHTLFSHDQTQVISLRKEYYKEEVSLTISYQGFFLVVTDFNNFYILENLYLLTYCCYAFLSLNIVSFGSFNVFIIADLKSSLNLTFGDREFFDCFSPCA